MMYFGGGEAPVPDTRRRAAEIAYFAPTRLPSSPCGRRWPAERVRATRRANVDERKSGLYAGSLRVEQNRNGVYVLDRDRYVPVPGSHLEEHP